MAPPYPDLPPPPPPPFPAPIPPPAGGGGAGCFAKGCLVVVAVVLVLGLLGAAGLFFSVRKLRDTLTSERARPVPIFPATDAQFAAVSGRLRAFQEALGRGERATLELSGDDLNILVARDPQYAAVRGKLFFSLREDRLFTEVSYPLDEIPNARRFGLAGRWLNGRAGLEIGFADGEPHLRLVSLESNGQKVNEAFVESFSNSFDQKFREGFQRRVERDAQGTNVWHRIESVEIRDDKIIVTSTGEEPQSARDERFSTKNKLARL